MTERCALHRERHAARRGGQLSLIHISRTLDEYEPLAPQPGDRVIVKPRFSAFFATQLDLVLRRLGVGTVVLIGTTTPNCIRTRCV